MNGQAELQTGPAPRRLALPYCPRCNDLQFAPAASEFVSTSHVRHQWSCEACGHEFSTSVRLSFSRIRCSLS
jgi:transcription elongation factor Elf1